MRKNISNLILDKRCEGVKKLILINFQYNLTGITIFSKKYSLIGILKPQQLFLYWRNYLHEFFVLIRRIELFYFLSCMFKLQISHIKQTFMILWIYYLENSENFPKEAIYCAYMGNALLMSYMSYKSLKIGKNCKKCWNHQLWPSVTQKLGGKKSEKIQGYSWDCYCTIKMIKEKNFVRSIL